MNKYLIVSLVVWLLFLAGCQAEKVAPPMSKVVNVPPETNVVEEVVNYQDKVLPFVIDLHKPYVELEQTIIDPSISTNDIWARNYSQDDPRDVFYEMRTIYYPTEYDNCSRYEYCQKFSKNNFQGLLIADKEYASASDVKYLKLGFIFIMTDADGVIYKNSLQIKEDDNVRIADYWQDLVDQNFTSQNHKIVSLLQTIETLQYTGGSELGDYYNLLPDNWYVKTKYNSENLDFTLDAYYPIMYIETKEVNLENFPKETGGHYPPPNWRVVNVEKQYIENAKIGTHCFPQQYIDDLSEDIKGSYLDENNYMFFNLGSGFEYCEYAQIGQIRGKLSVSATKPDAMSVIFQFTFYKNNKDGKTFQVVITGEHQINEPFTETSFRDFAIKLKNRALTEADGLFFYYYQESFKSLQAI